MAIFAYPILAFLLYLVFGQRVGAIAIMFWPLWLVWRFDNKLGTFLPVAVMLYIVFGIIAFMLSLFAAMATR